MTNVTRRTLLAGASALAASKTLPALADPAQPVASGPLTRVIPSSGEAMPLVGLGSWITFNVGNDPQLLDASADVIKAFLDAGGRMIDTSPMYGSAQSTIGYSLKKLGYPKPAFSADKVWTSTVSEGPSQMAESRNLWGLPKLDLIQIHNLLGWQGHLETLRAMKERGEVRYIGITTSHGRRHDLIEKILGSEPIDFVQVTYNANDREVESRILPLAKERGVAVIINRPYQRGALIRAVQSKPLPSWAAETGTSSWPQFLLKFVIAHPAVTCAIPATTSVEHVRENLNMASGPMPDAKLRQRMADYVASL